MHFGTKARRLGPPNGDFTIIVRSPTISARALFHLHCPYFSAGRDCARPRTPMHTIIADNDEADVAAVAVGTADIVDLPEAIRALGKFRTRSLIRNGL